jgi:hypothetical protein
MGYRPRGASSPLSPPRSGAGSDGNNCITSSEQQKSRSPGLVHSSLHVMRLQETLVPRAEAGTRRTPVRWEPTHESQRDRPSQLTGSGSSAGRRGEEPKLKTTDSAPLDSGNHINVSPQPPRPKRVPSASAGTASGPRSRWRRWLAGAQHFAHHHPAGRVQPSHRFGLHPLP